jgi:organic radical activating enzyme
MIPQNKTFDHRIDFDSWSKDNPHICSIPYQEVHYDLDHVSPCCWYDTSTAVDSVIEIKKNIESGTVDKNCHLCHKQEANQQFSGRQRALKQFPPSQLDDFLENRKIRFFYTFFMFGNKCNMACRMCSSDISSLYDSIWNNKKNIPKTASNDPDYWNTIKSDIRAKVDVYEEFRIVVMGGEGTIQEELYKLTDWLQEENLCKKIILQIGTNGSVFSEDKFTSWCDTFKRVAVAISVDSTHDDNFLYVRYPVKFEKIHENLQKFKSLAETKSNFDLHIAPTFYINNIAYLKEFLDYFENFEISGRQIRIYDNTLFRPNDLALAALPNVVKEKLALQVQDLLDHDYKIWNSSFTFKKSLESILGQLQSTEFSDEVWNKYISTTARWDKLTDTSLWTNNKKLWDLLPLVDQDAYHRARARLL